MPVTELSYIGLLSSDRDGWASILSEIVGMQRIPDAQPRTDYYRMDERDYRIFVETSETDHLGVVGWGVNSMEALDALSERIAAAGVVVDEGAADLIAQRGARAIRCFTDPEGYKVELAYAPPATEAPFASGRPISGFKTGELGMGHVVLHCAKYRENVSFYHKVLGFRISDYIVWADADATFMRCNPRHHSLALLNESLGMESGALNHIMFEMKSLADVGRAYDLVLDRKYPIIMTLGQHSNDKATSFYFVAPGGVGIEIGWNGVTIDNESEWQVAKYDSTKLWGHRMD